MHFIEIACFNKEAALAAAAAGAHRLELCSHKELGGVSPDLAWVKEVKETVNIPVYLMMAYQFGKPDVMNDIEGIVDKMMEITI
jgi:copper homeostasis protein CutC